MRKILLSALAATTMLSAGLLASRAAASTSDSLAVAVSTTNASLRIAAVVCGSGGCNAVQTKQVRQKKLQWLGHG
jgi:succinate dehydrogenase/fumarate reductase flavoprotein subunit